MTDVFDRASEREEEFRADALADQERRSRVGLGAESATECRICEAPIPVERQSAVPGVQTCIDCQTDLERACY